MSEKCPLAGGGYLPREIPEFCREHCEKLWDKATQLNQVYGGYDTYKNPEDLDEWDDCKHEGTSLEYSSDSLQSVDETPRRIYTIIDQCMSCEGEFGEQSYQFKCLNS